MSDHYEKPLSVLSAVGQQVLREGAKRICEAVIDGKIVIGFQAIAPEAIGILAGARINSRANGIIGIFRGPLGQVNYSPAILTAFDDGASYPNRYDNLFYVHEAPLLSAQTVDGTVLYSAEMLPQEDQSELQARSLRCRCLTKCPIHDRTESTGFIPLSSVGDVNNAPLGRGD